MNKPELSMENQTPSLIWTHIPKGEQRHVHYIVKFSTEIAKKLFRSQFWVYIIFTPKSLKTTSLVSIVSGPKISVTYHRRRSN